MQNSKPKKTRNSIKKVRTLLQGRRDKMSARCLEIAQNGGNNSRLAARMYELDMALLVVNGDPLPNYDEIARYNPTPK